VCDKAGTNDESATPEERLVVEGVADEAMVDSADAEEINDENDDENDVCDVSAPVSSVRSAACGGKLAGTFNDAVEQ
jgi:hypothetical protein